MAKLVLPDIGTLSNQSSAREAMNNNFDLIEDALENTLSRDGTTPNQMTADLDLNSNSVLNVADPVNDGDAVNKRSVGALVDAFVSEIAETIIEGTARVDIFTATASQTEFPLSDAPSGVDGMFVYDNGVAMVPGVDFTLSGDTLQTLEFFVGRTVGHTIVARYVELSPADSALRADLAATSAAKGSALVSHFSDADGAVSRTSQEKLREQLSVQDFGAVGNGVTDDTLAIIDAVAAAVDVSGELVWPAGSYLTTATIPNLHTVRHVGPGTIKRGTDTFYPNPKSGQVNRLYVATTGNDANDGLSSAQPALTINAHMNRLPNYGPVLNGDWRIMLAAGTYGQCTFPSGLGNKAYIRLWGPAVGHPNVPTAIIDAGGVSNNFCISAQGHVLMDVRDVKLQNAPGSLAIGLAATMFCDVYCNNVHTDNISSGIQVTQNSRLRQTGGIHTPGANGVAGVAVGVGSTFSIGYQAAGFGLGPQFNGAFSQAVKITENSTGHVDYCVIDGAQIGIELTQNCRMNDVSNDIKNCTTAGIRSTQSCYANAGNVFTANATNFINDAYSVHLPIATGSQGTLRQGISTATITHTGTVAKTTLATLNTIPAGYFTDNSKQLRVRITGKFTSAGVITVGFDLGGGVVSALASAGATAGTQFEAEINLYATGAAAQKYQEKLIQGTVVARHASSTRAIDMSSARAIQIVGTLPNAADTLVIDTAEAWLVG